MESLQEAANEPIDKDKLIASLQKELALERARNKSLQEELRRAREGIVQMVGPSSEPKKKNV